MLTMAFAFLVWLVTVLMLRGAESCFTMSENHTIYVKKGTAYYGECSCTTPGYNVRHLRWVDAHNQEIDELRPGTDQKAYTERQIDSVSLHIPNVTKSKSGLYRCITNYEGRDYSQNYYVLAYEPITINPPEEQYILLGNRSLVRCKVHAEDDSKVITSWNKVEADKTIEITKSDKYEITEDGLYINDVAEEDKGLYSCSAIDRETYDEVDKDINVKIITSPIIKDLKVVPRPTVIAGEILVMECVADGIPHPEYIWRNTNGNLIDNPRWKQEVNAIMIDPVLPEDQGKYECVAQSMAGVVSRSVDIQVFFPPNITSFPSMTAVEGSTVELVCNSIGRPAPNVSIIFIGHDEDEIRDVDEDDVMDNLSFIKKVDKSHEGFYVCNASNEVNYTLEEMYLSVQYKPYFEQTEEIIWGWSGQVVNLSCLPESNPPPNISWRFLSEDPSSIRDVHQFIIDSTKDGPYTLNVNVSDDTDYLYGTYECKGSNSLGYAVKYIHFRKGHIPPPIKNATATIVTATSATFSIERPNSFLGPPILGYTAEYDKSEHYNITNIHSNRTWSKDRPFTIDNLRADTSYFIRFAPINRVGHGEWSTHYKFKTLEPSVPNPPIWDMIAESENESEEVTLNANVTEQDITWKAPEDNGAPVDYYTVKYCPILEEEPCKENTVDANEELKLDLSNLDQNTTYFVELTAHNYIGNSTPVNITITTPAKLRFHPIPLLSSGALIAISVVAVFACLVILDVILLMWRKQGIIATLCLKKKKKSTESSQQTRDKKGLLKDSERTSDNGHKEFEYNKTTGIITGKHSAV